MTKQSLRIIFAGTPEFAAIHLKALIESEHLLTAVYTQPDRPAGRGRKLQASPVKQLARDAGLSVLQPLSLKDEGEQRRLGELEADLMVVVAYGLILPPGVLSAPAMGCVNVHASLLPRWRGAAPIQRAIEAGDTETGLTIMQMDAGLDTGDMLATARCAIDNNTTAADLHDTLAELGPPLLLQVLGKLPAFIRDRRKQDDSLATYARKISKSETAIDWSRDARQLDCAIRAFNPVPVCYSVLANQRVKLWQARPAGTGRLPEAPGTILSADRRGILVNCGRGQLSIQRLQLPGGKPLTAEQILNAHTDLFAPGTVFSVPPANKD